MINVDGAVLRGRRREQEKLDQLLRDVHGGRSRVLVRRGEAGAGKTALLDYLGGAGGAGRVIRTAGVELETEIDYSGLQQLCAPYLSALGAAVHAGRLGGDDRRRAARAARAIPAGDEPAGLFLTALATWSLDGYPASVPELRRALAAAEDVNLLWLAIPVAHEVFDDQAWHGLSERAVVAARRAGALSVLPSALSFRAGALLHAGRFADAAALIDEMEALAEATGLPPDPSGPMNLLALRGQEQPTLDLIAAVAKDAESRDEGRPVDMADHVRTLLFNGLGRFPAALQAGRRAAQYPDLGFHHWALSELVEAAARAGDGPEAESARSRLAELTGPAGTPWALGAQAVADALAGPVAKAEENFRAAIDLLPPSRLGLQRARARLLYGSLRPGRGARSRWAAGWAGPRRGRSRTCT